LHTFVQKNVTAVCNAQTWALILGIVCHMRITFSLWLVEEAAFRVRLLQCDVEQNILWVKWSWAYYRLLWLYRSTSIVLTCMH